MTAYKIIAVNLSLVFILCFAGATDAGNLAKSFYSSPDEIIKNLDNESAGFKEHFLLGLACKKTGKLKKAIFHFANSCFQYSRDLKLKIYPSPVYKYINGFHIKSDFYDDAAYEVAALFFEYREFEYTIKFVDLIRKSNSVLFRDAAILKSNAMLESGEHDDAILSLKELLSQYDDINSRSLIHIRMASAYERKNDFLNAVREYFNVLRLDVKTWQAGIASDRIPGIASKHKYQFSDKESLLLAVSLYHNSKSDSSTEILKDLIKKELDEPLKNEVLTYSIKGYIRTGKPDKAENLISQYSRDPSLYYRFLKTEADELWAVKKRQLAFIIYQKLYKAAKGEILRDSHKRIVQFLIDRNASGYENILLEYKDKYPKNKSSEYFLWSLARNKLKEKNYKASIKYMEESLSLFPEGSYSARNRFWLSKLYANAGRDSDSMQKIKEMIVINPNSPYIWRRLEQLKDKYKIEELKNKFKDSTAARDPGNALFFHTMLFMQEKDIVERDRRIHAMDFINALKKYKEFEDNLQEPKLDSKYEDSLKRIEKYFAIGYSDGINRETGIIPNKTEFQIDKYKTLAHLGEKYNNYYFTVTSILELLKYYKLKENIAVLSGGTLLKLFPAAFSEQVEGMCSEKNITKEVVYAVMKAESSFNHKAVSSAGAIGLMQLMPATAKGIAKEMKIKEFDLRDPSTSISFGIKYLAWLNKFFNGDFENMVAGYNAGAGNVKNWIKDLNNADDDYFIEFIPFDETRYYVLRTNKFFVQYQLIYNSTP